MIDHAAARDRLANALRSLAAAEGEREKARSEREDAIAKLGDAEANYRLREHKVDEALTEYAETRATRVKS